MSKGARETIKGRRIAGSIDDFLAVIMVTRLTSCEGDFAPL
jgi:hypothetical protein